MSLPAVISDGALTTGEQQPKMILIFGAGKSATCLIEYLIKEAGINGWMVIVADANLLLAQLKAGLHNHVQAVAVNVEVGTERNQLIQKASIVISLLPPDLHFLVAQSCVQFEKNLLTASYTDDNIRGLQQAVDEKKLLFLCEMGLDPGIDHMSAAQLIHRLKQEGATITSFVSHCGGLVAPESNDNPWCYKLSWNPRNIVMAGKAGAIYRQQNSTQKETYEQLFDETRCINVPGLGAMAWYPNRDSLGYTTIYELENVETFIRTTLRYPPFCYGWKHIVRLQLTDESVVYDTNGMTLASFFSSHFERHGFATEMETKRQQQDTLIDQLEYIGLSDTTTILDKGACSALDVLQFAMEKYLSLKQDDKDMIVMLHEIEYLLQGQSYKTRSSLLVKGNDSLYTAMAKTVGLPLGIAAVLILQKKITTTGLHIPVVPSIYEPVLEQLRVQGIAFEESTVLLNNRV